jgi:type IV secretion system protein VirB8
MTTADAAARAETRRRYFTESQTWAHDTLDGLRKRASGARLVAGVALAVGAVQAGVIAHFATRGPSAAPPAAIAGADGGLRPGPVNADMAVRRSAIAHFVVARETYNPMDLESSWRRAAAQSVEAARADLLRAWDRANPLAIPNALPTGTTIAVSVNAVELTGPQTAKVSFTLTRRDAAGQVTLTEAGESEVAFRFSAAPMPPTDRLLNPLGLQVTRYRRTDTAAGTAGSADLPNGNTAMTVPQSSVQQAPAAPGASPQSVGPQSAGASGFPTPADDPTLRPIVLPPSSPLMVPDQSRPPPDQPPPGALPE